MISSFSFSQETENVDVVNVGLFVGIGKYAEENHVSLTHGPLEAARMRKIYADRGYRARQVDDGEDGVVSKAEIIDAVDAIREEIGDRIVGDFTFYFTGHGSFKVSSKEAVILPGDASSDCEERTFTADQLEDLLRRVPAERRTIILDSCHSGAMASRTIQLGSTYPDGQVITLFSPPKKKIGEPSQEGDVLAIPVKSADFTGRTGLPQSLGQQGGNFVYICSAGPNEPALAVKSTNPEKSFSFFSRQLREVLQKDDEIVKLGSAGDVIKEVGKGLAGLVGQIFRPTTNGLARLVTQFFPNAFKIPAKTKNREFWQQLVTGLTGVSGSEVSDTEVERFLNEALKKTSQGAGQEGKMSLLRDFLIKNLPTILGPEAKLNPAMSTDDLAKIVMPLLTTFLAESQPPAAEEQDVQLKSFIGQLHNLGNTDPNTLSLQIIKKGTEGDTPGVNVLKIDDQYDVEMRCTAKKGWLLLLNSDEKGDTAVQWPFYMLFDKNGIPKVSSVPDSFSLDLFQVVKLGGDSKRVAFEGFTEPGIERWTAVYFPERTTLLDTVELLFKTVKLGSGLDQLTGIQKKDPKVIRATITVTAQK